MMFRYFLNYNHFLPILDPFQAPDEYYDKSELLFWVLISIAARKWDHVVSGVITKVILKVTQPFTILICFIGGHRYGLGSSPKPTVISV
jgi:hypothetical protein